jgi:hypothetical protein
MEVLSNGKVRRTAAEWQAIFTRFERSVLTDRKFCLRESLNLTSFRRWRQRVSGSGDDAGPVADRFVEMTPPITPPAPATIELEFPDGRVLRIRG